jgi:cytoskeleton protein RodZ
MSASSGSSDTADTKDSAIGARLRDARMMRKLQTGEVAEKLHLDVGIIDAIEQGDMTKLPAPIFVQGYVRSYARLVGLPEDELIREFTAQHAELPPLTVHSAESKSPRLRLPSGRLVRNVILVMLAIILLWLAWPFLERLVTWEGGETADQVPGRLELPPAYEGEQRPEPPG